jgi:hypothetical protein
MSINVQHFAGTFVLVVNDIYSVQVAPGDRVLEYFAKFVLQAIL